MANDRDEKKMAKNHAEWFHHLACRKRRGGVKLFSVGWVVFGFTGRDCFGGCDRSIPRTKGGRRRLDRGLDRSPKAPRTFLKLVSIW